MNDKPSETPSRRPPADSGSGRPFRMRIPAAVDDEKRFQELRRAELVQRYHTWVSAVFMLACLTLVLWVAFIVARLVNASPIVGLFLVLSFLPGTFATWGAGSWAAWRTHDRRWLAVLGLVPLAALLVAFFAGYAPYIIPPVPCILGIVWGWSKRDMLAEPGRRA